MDIKSFKALFRMDENGEIKKVQKVEYPKSLAEDGIVVKMHYAPINPSDWMFFLKNSYGERKKLVNSPVIPGFEGSGIIEDVGSNVDQKLLGKKVSIITDVYDFRFSGTWTEYFFCKREDLIIFPDEAKLENIHSSFINPCSVFAMYEKIKHKNSESVLINAANSSLCQMAIRYFKQNQIKTLSIVRRESHKKKLLEIGAESVLSTSSERYEEELKSLIETYKPNLFFDAVAGSEAVKIFQMLPNNSVMYNYGALSMKSFDGLNPQEFIFHNKKIK